MTRLSRASRALGAFAVGAPLALSGCAAFSDSDTAGVEVVASFYPLAFVAEQIGGPDLTVTDLTLLGQEPHDLELTIAQTAAISEADVVVKEDGLQPAVDDTVAQVATGRVVDAADVVGLRPFPADEQESGLDPHFWQDPLLLAKVADAVASALEAADPEHSSGYAARARDLDEQLTALDQEYRTGLAHCERTTIVVSHAAFGYLETYGLHVAAIAGLSPDAEPTPADLQRLQGLIRSDGITTVFGERLAPPSLVQTLASDAGVRTAVLDPIEGLTDETADQDYFSLMRSNLAALQQANACRT